MCETKAVVVSIWLILLVAASFCIYQAPTENKVGNHSKIKSQGPCENEYKKNCLNRGECYYLVTMCCLTCCYIFYSKSRKKNLSKSDALYFFQVKIWRVVFFFNSKSEALYFFQFKIWRVFFSTENLTRNEIFNTKSCFLKQHKKCKVCRFHGVEWPETWYFECKDFSKI